MENNKTEYTTLIILVSLLGVTVTTTSYAVYAQNQTGGFFGDILELSNTLFLVAIPAVTGLIIAVGTVIGQVIKNKKFNEGFEVAKNGMLMATTYGQKTNDMLKKWGPFVEIGLKNLPVEEQERLKAVGLTVNDINAMIEASADQILKLKEKVPDFADPDNLDMLREQDVLKRQARFNKDNQDAVF